jgi:hypothetical protein
MPSRGTGATVVGLWSRCGRFRRLEPDVRETPGPGGFRRPIPNAGSDAHVLGQQEEGQDPSFVEKAALSGVKFFGIDGLLYVFGSRFGVKMLRESLQCRAGRKRVVMPREEVKTDGGTVR